VTGLLLADELALLAVRPWGRRPLGSRDVLNACLAGLLLAELRLPDHPRDSSTLAAVAAVAQERGPRLRPILSAMDRQLTRHTGQGTWQLVTADFHSLEPAVRENLVQRLRDAALEPAAADLRTAIVLAFTGPARLIEVVAPRRRTRRHVRRRVDHLLDGTSIEAVLGAVRKELADQQAAVAAAVVCGAVASSCG
jgi:hypothetical protein